MPTIVAKLASTAEPTTVPMQPVLASAMPSVAKTSALSKEEKVLVRKMPATSKEAVSPVSVTSVASAPQDMIVKEAEVIARSAAHAATAAVVPSPLIAVAPVAGAVTTPGIIAPQSIAPHAEPETAMQVGDARTFAATPRALEVGVATGTHGWLRVRAELGAGGEVSASVVASSPVAAEALHRSLPALRDYLVQERVGVDSVAVASLPVRPEGGQQSATTGLEGQAGDGDQRGRQGVAHQLPQTLPAMEASFSFSSVEVPLPASNGAGGWVNVRV